MPHVLYGTRQVGCRGLPLTLGKEEKHQDFFFKENVGMMIKTNFIRRGFLQQARGFAVK